MCAVGYYYPPNRQLVIGMDMLDSFQELAELLGQVKPPTATKEDIGNSGLDVIRSSVLADYEKVRWIASMCVDRVRLYIPFCLGIDADESSVPDLSGGLRP